MMIRISELLNRTEVLTNTFFVNFRDLIVFVHVQNHVHEEFHECETEPLSPLSLHFQLTEE
jgi:hypothetical protein